MILDTLIAFGLTYYYRGVESYASLDPPTFQKRDRVTTSQPFVLYFVPSYLAEVSGNTGIDCISSFNAWNRYFEVSIKPRETASLMSTKHKASNNEEENMEAESQEVGHNQKAEKTDHVLAETPLRRRHSRKTPKEAKKRRYYVGIYLRRHSCLNTRP